MRAYGKRNRSALTKKSRERYKTDPLFRADIRRRSKKWLAKPESREKRLASSRRQTAKIKSDPIKYREALDRHLVYMKEHVRTPEYKEKRRAWYQRYHKNPKNAMVRRLRSRVRFALKARGFSYSAVTLLGCTKDEFLRYIESLFVSGMTWENRWAWHLDHRKPIASFDFNDPEQVRACFHWSNYQPLWAHDNIVKGCSVVPDTSSPSLAETPTPPLSSF
jgi:hypothetical protein